MTFFIYSPIHIYRYGMGIYGGSIYPGFMGGNMWMYADGKTTSDRPEGVTA